MYFKKYAKFNNKDNRNDLMIYLDHNYLFSIILSLLLLNGFYNLAFKFRWLTNSFFSIKNEFFSTIINFFIIVNLLGLLSFNFFLFNEINNNN